MFWNILRKSSANSFFAGTRSDPVLEICFQSEIAAAYPWPSTQISPPLSSPIWDLKLRLAQKSGNLANFPNLIRTEFTTSSKGWNLRPHKHNCPKIFFHKLQFVRNMQPVCREEKGWIILFFFLDMVKVLYLYLFSIDMMPLFPHIIILSIWIHLNEENVCRITSTSHRNCSIARQGGGPSLDVLSLDLFSTEASVSRCYHFIFPGVITLSI